MYHHSDRRNRLFIMRYVPFLLHGILWSKLASGGGFYSKPLSRLQQAEVDDLVEVTVEVGGDSIQLMDVEVECCGIGETGEQCITAQHW